MVKFTIINQSKTVDSSKLQPMAEAIMLAANRDFLPAWNPGGSIEILADGSTPDGATKITLVDEAPAPNAEGYHEAPGGQADIIIQIPDVPVGALATVISHEIFETLVDWLAILMVDGTWDAPVFYECADPVEDQTYDVNGYPVSDFVLPHWFVEGSSGPWDFLKKLAGPFTLSPGGYVALNSGQQVWGSEDRKAAGLKSWRRGAKRTAKVQAA